MNKTSFFSLNFIFLLFLAVLFRIFALDHIPGINGDEAWYGLTAQKLLAGEDIGYSTPTGNILNYFYIIPLVLFEYFFSSSFWVLRMPALLFGLLLLPATYVLIKNIFNKEIAVSVTILSAVIPVNIVYSRFGWDASITPLVSLFVIFFLYKKRWLTLGLICLIAYIVHPTNIFLLAIIFPFIFLSMILSEDGGIRTESPAKILTLILFAAAIFLLLYMFFNLSGRTLLVEGVIERAMSIDEWGMFLMDYMRLLSGTTVYRYISGAGETGTFYIVDKILVCAWLILNYFGYRELWKNRETDKCILLVSFYICLLSVFLLFGNYQLLPGNERYGMFLVMPSLLIIGILISTMNRDHGRIMINNHIVISMAWALVFSFLLNYFIYIINTGGTAHKTFQTNYVEPKERVLQIIHSDLGKNKTGVVLTSGWWLSQPMQYLAEKYDNISVVSSFSSDSKHTVSDDNNLYIVIFSNDEMEKNIEHGLHSQLEQYWEIMSYSERPLLVLYKIRQLNIEIIKLKEI